MDYFERINAIAKVCAKNDVPYTMNPIFEGWQIRFPWCDGDVVIHDGSHGHRIGLVESYCFPWDDGDVSAMTSEEMADKIVEFYNHHKR